MVHPKNFSFLFPTILIEKNKKSCPFGQPIHLFYEHTNLYNVASPGTQSQGVNSPV